MKWVALLACTGCWVAQPAAIVQPAPVSEAQPLAASHADHSLWRGRYMCAQGPTALELTLGHRNDALIATFSFGPLDENPSVPRGSYRMTGVLTETAGGEMYISLAPAEWIDQPPGYVMVGLQAQSSNGRRVLRGKMDHESCGELEITRVE